MRKAIFVIGALIFLDIIYFSYINRGQTLTMNYKPFIDSFSFNSGLVYLFMGFYGALGGYLISYYKSFALKDKVKKLLRNVEKTSVVSEESQDKVKALELKIETLEAALKAALNK